MTTALYRRYRPETFADVIGQEHVTDPLMAAIDKDRINHAYLFSGPRGCGKTTSARILARCLNCAQGPTSTPCGTCDSCVELARNGSGSLDVIEIDAASHGGVDDARDLRERATFAPVRDRFKIFIIDEAHMVTSAGFNALLKIVEEPPEHILFIFATTEPDKVIGTIRSRTHHYPFRLVPPEPLMAYLDLLCRQENVPVAPGVLSLVIRAGGGSVRDSLSVLDQLMAGAGENGLDYELAVSLLGYTHATLLDDVVDSIAAGDAGTVFNAVDRVIQTGHDPRRFVEDLLERFRDLIVINAVPEGAASILRGVPDDQLNRMRTQATQLGAGELSRAADVTNTALTEMTGATSPRLHLELLCARLLLPAADATARGTLARVDRIERRLEYAGGGDGVGQSAPVPPAAPSTIPTASAPDAPGTLEPAASGASADSPETPAAAAAEDAPAAPARPRLDVPRTAEEAAARWSLPAADPNAPAIPSAVPGAHSPAIPSAVRPPSESGSSDWGASWGVSNSSAFAEPEAPEPAKAAPQGAPVGSDAATQGLPTRSDVAPQSAPVESDAAPQGAPTRSDAASQGVPGAQETGRQEALLHPDATPQGTRAESDPAPQGVQTESDTAPRFAPAQADPAPQGVPGPSNARPQEVSGQASAERSAERPPSTPEWPRATQQPQGQPQGSQQGSQQPQSAANPQTQATGGTIEMVRRAWPEIMDEVAQIKRATWLIVNVSAKPRSFDGNQLVLAFANQGNAIGFQRGPHVDNVKQAIHKVLGLTCSIEAMHDAGGSGESGPKVRGSDAVPGSNPGRGPVAPSSSSAPATEHSPAAPITAPVERTPTAPNAASAERAQPAPNPATAESTPTAPGVATAKRTQSAPNPAAGEVTSAPPNRAAESIPPAQSAASGERTPPAPNPVATDRRPAAANTAGEQASAAPAPAREAVASRAAGPAANTVPPMRPAQDAGEAQPDTPQQKHHEPRSTNGSNAGQKQLAGVPSSEVTGAWNPSMSDDSWALVEPPEDSFDPGGQWDRMPDDFEQRSAADTPPRSADRSTAQSTGPQAPPRSTPPHSDSDAGLQRGHGSHQARARGSAADGTAPRGPATEPSPPSVGTPTPEASRSVVWSPDLAPARRPEQPGRPGGGTGDPPRRGPVMPSSIPRADADAPTQAPPSSAGRPPSVVEGTNRGRPTATGSHAAPPHPGAEDRQAADPGRRQKPASRYQQLLDEAERKRAEELAATRGAVDLRFVEDEPSADDETLEDSGLVGRTAIERILNGRLVEERKLDGQ